MRFPFRFWQLSLLLGLTFTLGACAEVELASHVAKSTPSQGSFKVGNPYKVEGQWYNPTETYEMSQTGIASWYGPGFHGKKTANGEIYNMNELTAAHKTLQLPSLVRVTNLDNGKSVIVRVNDRGPFSRGRIIDLSSKAADLLDMKRQGTAKVKLQVLNEESRRIAEAAKQGQLTRGYEVALNQAPQNAVYTPTMTSPTAPVPAVQSAAVPGHITQGHFYPDPVVKQMPVAHTNIFVQAGSFSDQANAEALAQRLSTYGRTNVAPAMVNGRQYFRVRFGPIASVNEADSLLGQLANAGYGDAMTVVD